MKNIKAKTLFGGIISLEWLVQLNFDIDKFWRKTLHAWQRADFCQNQLLCIVLTLWFEVKI